MKLIDISEHQGIIDWNKVKPNVDGVMIRAGYGRNHIDKYFQRNIEECNRLDIPCGAYWFSYAYNTGLAKAEAEYLAIAVKPYKVELPLAFDFEYDSITNAQKNGVTVTKALVSGLVRTFCEEIEKAGYWCLNYSNPDLIKRYLDDSVVQRFGLWLAQWKNNPNVNKPPRACDIWQWGGSSIPGIVGSVDTDECYKDFKKIISDAGLNNLKKADNTQTVIIKDGYTWAKSYGVVTDSMVYGKEIAEAIYRYHNVFHNDDYEDRASGLLGGN